MWMEALKRMRSNSDGQPVFKVDRWVVVYCNQNSDVAVHFVNTIQRDVAPHINASFANPRPYDLVSLVDESYSTVTEFEHIN